MHLEISYTPLQLSPESHIQEPNPSHHVDPERRSAEGGWVLVGSRMAANIERHGRTETPLAVFQTSGEPDCLGRSLAADQLSEHGLRDSDFHLNWFQSPALLWPQIRLGG